MRNTHRSTGREPLRAIRCAIYTRKSTDKGLEQEFNSLDAQREAGEAFIKSQAAEGWICLPDRYDDGGFSGDNLDHPAVKRLLAEVESNASWSIRWIAFPGASLISRGMMGTLGQHNCSFVSGTQQFNTTHSAKHFSWTGNSTSDAYFGLPVVTATFEEMMHEHHEPYGQSLWSLCRSYGC